MLHVIGFKQDFWFLAYPIVFQMFISDRLLWYIK